MKLATLCYLRHEGKTLMVHRIKKENDIHQGKWNGLGGKIEQGETPEECVTREMYEESGLHIHNPLLRGVLTFPKFADDEDWYAFVFVADKFDGELIDSPEGDLRWISNEEVFNLPMWEGDRIFLPWLDKPFFFSGKFVYQDGKLVEHSVVFHELPQNQR
jgi:8-oxo-dGTP diphosphatase